MITSKRHCPDCGESTPHHTYSDGSDGGCVVCWHESESAAERQDHERDEDMA